MNRERLETTLLKVLRIAGLAFFIALGAFPFYWMIISSLKPLEEILLHPANLGLDIRQLDFRAYYEVLFEHGFARYIVNSAYVSATTVLLSLVLAAAKGRHGPGDCPSAEPFPAR